MKFIKLSFILLTVLMFSNSCSNEFDITAEPRDIPVVYGVLQANAPVHYLRIEKAFLDPAISPLIQAQIADSLYYDESVTVDIEDMDTGERFRFQRVDARDEGFVREEGIFATEPNYIYRISGSEMPLEGGERLQLQINRGENEELVTAETTVLPPLTIQSPRAALIRTWTETVRQRVSWIPRSDNTEIFDIEFVFNYTERINDPDAQPVDKSVSFFPIRNRLISDAEANSALLSNEISGASFYQFVGQAIDGNINAIRAARGLDVIVHGGATEIKDFFTVSIANAGITGSQDPPVFTNISSGGRGIFSSSTSATFSNIQLELEARDSLLSGRFTRDLNFQ